MRGAGLVEIGELVEEPLPLSDFDEVSRQFLKSNPQLIPAGVVKRLREIRSIWKKAQDDIDGRGNVEYASQFPPLAKKKLSGDSIAGAKLISQPELEAKAEERKLYGLEQQRQCRIEVAQLGEQVFPGLLAAFDTWIVEGIRVESELHQTHGVRFSPDRSHLALGLRAAQARLNKNFQNARVNKSAETKILFEFLDLDSEPKP